jgi:hypothetical protein
LGSQLERAADANVIAELANEDDRLGERAHDRYRPMRTKS